MKPQSQRPLARDVILASIVVMALTFLVALVLWKCRCDRARQHHEQTLMEFDTELPAGVYRDPLRTKSQQQLE